MTLLADPLAGIGIPRVAMVIERAQRRLDLIPSSFVVEALADERHDECAPAPGSSSPVELSDKIVVKLYV